MRIDSTGFAFIAGESTASNRGLNGYLLWCHSKKIWGGVEPLILEATIKLFSEKVIKIDFNYHLWIYEKIFDLVF
ncbi:MAG: hypothetical protein ACI8WM_002094 [Burkholderiaceae bacterium]|jgi:hypothetical protein